MVGGLPSRLTCDQVNARRSSVRHQRAAKRPDCNVGKRHRRRRADPVSRPRGVPHCWHKLWWALQTVTTVGYGDVTPENAIGRVLGAIIMLESIEFVAIITAAITSSFVEWARREQTTPADLEECLRIEQLAEELADIKEPLEQMQRTLDRGGSA
jgi:ion channel